MATSSAFVMNDTVLAMQRGEAKGARAHIQLFLRIRNAVSPPDVTHNLTVVYMRWRLLYTIMVWMQQHPEEYTLTDSVMYFPRLTNGPMSQELRGLAALFDLYAVRRSKTGNSRHARSLSPVTPQRENTVLFQFAGFIPVMMKQPPDGHIDLAFRVDHPWLFNALGPRDAFGHFPNGFSICDYVEECIQQQRYPAVLIERGHLVISRFEGPWPDDLDTISERFLYRDDSEEPSLALAMQHRQAVTSPINHYEEVLATGGAATPAPLEDKEIEEALERMLSTSGQEDFNFDTIEQAESEPVKRRKISVAEDVKSDQFEEEQRLFTLQATVAKSSLPFAGLPLAHRIHIVEMILAECRKDISF